MAMRAVVFDVGETLINEARLWQGWARYLGISYETFAAALDDAIADGAHHRTVFERLRPGLDIEAARRERVAAGETKDFDQRDLYPDALPCLKDLRGRGLRVGIAGNQPVTAEAALRQLDFEADFVASSAGWGVAKPSPDFFTKVVEAAGMPAEHIAYVGDRLDNDVLPARAAGMFAIFIERGPWGRAHANHPDIVKAHAIVQSLTEVPDVLATLKVVRPHAPESR